MLLGPISSETDIEDFTTTSILASRDDKEFISSNNQLSETKQTNLQDNCQITYDPTIILESVLGVGKTIPRLAHQERTNTSLVYAPLLQWTRTRGLLFWEPTEYPATHMPKRTTTMEHLTMTRRLRSNRT